MRNYFRNWICLLEIRDRVRESRPTSCNEVECQNGGECIETDRHAKCQCADGFVGRQCQYEGKCNYYNTQKYT